MTLDIGYKQSDDHHLTAYCNVSSTNVKIFGVHITFKIRGRRRPCFLLAEQCAPAPRSAVLAEVPDLSRMV